MSEELITQNGEAVSDPVVDTGTQEPLPEGTGSEPTIPAQEAQPETAKEMLVSLGMSEDVAAEAAQHLATQADFTRARQKDTSRFSEMEAQNAELQKTVNQLLGYVQATQAQAQGQAPSQEVPETPFDKFAGSLGEGEDVDNALPLLKQIYDASSEAAIEQARLERQQELAQLRTQVAPALQMQQMQQFSQGLDQIGNKLKETNGGDDFVKQVYPLIKERAMQAHMAGGIPIGKGQFRPITEQDIYSAMLDPSIQAKRDALVLRQKQEQIKQEEDKSMMGFTGPHPHEVKEPKKTAAQINAETMAILNLKNKNRVPAKTVI
jgi:hypothetical protein